jgi:hypothetical protein
MLSLTVEEVGGDIAYGRGFRGAAEQRVGAEAGPQSFIADGERRREKSAALT